MPLNRIFIVSLLLLLLGKVEMLYQLPSRLAQERYHNELSLYKNTPYTFESLYSQAEEQVSSEAIDEFEEDTDHGQNGASNTLIALCPLSSFSLFFHNKPSHEPPLTKKRLFILYSSLKLDC